MPRWTKDQIIAKLEEASARLEAFRLESLDEDRIDDFLVVYRPFERAVIRALRAGINHPAATMWVEARRSTGDYHTLRNLKLGLEKGLRQLDEVDVWLARNAAILMQGAHSMRSLSETRKLLLTHLNESPWPEYLLPRHLQQEQGDKPLPAALAAARERQIRAFKAAAASILRSNQQLHAKLAALGIRSRVKTRRSTLPKDTPMGGLEEVEAARDGSGSGKLSELDEDGFTLGRGPLDRPPRDALDKAIGGFRAFVRQRRRSKLKAILASRRREKR